MFFRGESDNSNEHRVLYLRAVALQIPWSKFENSNILDHTHSTLKHLYCSLWTCWTPTDFFPTLYNINTSKERERVRDHLIG